MLVPTIFRKQGFKIRQFIYSRTVKLPWVPRHCDFAGNETNWQPGKKPKPAVPFSGSILGISNILSTVKAFKKKKLVGFLIF
jgi:hypothetical protein